jgi:hypothetical protein
MFNKTLKQIAHGVRENLFNPDQSGSPQPWHVPKNHVFDITEDPDHKKVPRVVFTLGPLESDTRNRVEAFDNQPVQKIVTEEIIPEDHDFAQTYTLENKPLNPIIRVRALKTDETELDLAETDDYRVNYDTGQVTFREDVSDISTLYITFRTGEVTGPGAAVHLIQLFSIEVTGEDVMKAEAITAIVIGVIEAFKENILAEPDTTYNGLDVTTLLKAIEIQLVNKAGETAPEGPASVKLNYHVPGMMLIARKVPEEDLSIIEKIFHPDVVESEHDVVVKVNT